MGKYTSWRIPARGVLAAIVSVVLIPLAPALVCIQRSRVPIHTRTRSPTRWTSPIRMLVLAPSVVLVSPIVPAPRAATIPFRSPFRRPRARTRAVSSPVAAPIIPIVVARAGFARAVALAVTVSCSGATVGLVPHLAAVGPPRAPRVGVRHGTVLLFARRNECFRWGLERKGSD